MRGIALSTLLTKLKAAVGDSLTVGTQTDALYKQLLADKQQLLAGEYDYPFLKTQWNVTAAAGSRYLDLPTTAIDGTTDRPINHERPIAAFTLWNNYWYRLRYDISEQPEYNFLNPDADFASFSQQPMDPIARWQHHDATQFEVWPIPVTEQTVRFVGQRAVRALVANDDVCDIDAELIVLSLAVDILSKRKSMDAQLRLAAAMARLRSIRASYPTRDRQVILGGRVERCFSRGRRPLVGVTRVLGGGAGGGGIFGEGGAVFGEGADVPPAYQNGYAPATETVL